MENEKEKGKLNFPFSKPKTLHELLKQGSGHNLVLDFSLLSKRGGLLEKAKVNQNINNSKISSETTDTEKTKISKNFEILSKLGKRKKKIENLNNIENKEININDNIQNVIINNFNNKINITKKETSQDNENNDEIISQECLELKYDNPFNSDKEEKSENNNSNKNFKKVMFNQETDNKNENNKKMIKPKNKNLNNNINNYNNIDNNEYETNYFNKEEKPIKPQFLDYSTYSITEQSEKIKQFHFNKKNKKIHRPFVITKSPNIDKEEFYNYNARKNNYKKNKKINNINQIIEYETIKESYTIKHCSCVLEYSFREDQNIDSELLMEDKSKSIENFNNDKSQMIFEIFDGHGGDEMSTYLQSNLAKIYKQNLLLNKGNIILSLKNAFLDADDEMRGQINIEGLGSTGTLVHIVGGLDNNLDVYSANVGDSRVSLISPEHIIRLSYDHRTTDEKEKKRILESGMEIIDNRICGTLMLTRIFGNYEYKEENENDDRNINNNKGLICVPFISKINIDLSIENQFLILASDGIWDVLTEEEIQNIIKKCHDTQTICSIIIKKCLENEAWDNMSVFAVKLT